MTRPEDALALARATVDERRVAGDYGDDLSGFRIEPIQEVRLERLLEWALVEPDIEKVYSTRRFGRPITAVKRALIWATRQYHGQVYGEQTRFNHHIALFAGAYNERVRELEREVSGLEERIRRLESTAPSDDRPPAP